MYVTQHTNCDVSLKTTRIPFMLHEGFPVCKTGILRAYKCWVTLHGGVNMAQTEQFTLLQEASFHPH